jgi:hypothetical protein
MDVKHAKWLDGTPYGRCCWPLMSAMAERRRKPAVTTSRDRLSGASRAVFVFEYNHACGIKTNFNFSSGFKNRKIAAWDTTSVRRKDFRARPTGVYQMWDLYRVANIVLLRFVGQH